MKTYNKHFSKRRSGFTLVEVIAVCTIVGIMAGMMIFPVLGMIDNTRKRAEREKLAKIADEIRASFTVVYQENNISALPDELPWNPTLGTAAMLPTQFDPGNPLALSSGVTRHDWFMKLARLRGQGDASLATTEGSAAHDIAVNSWQGRRVLYAGPSESNVQRYVLLSFMFPEEDLPAIPPPAEFTSYAEWFDAIYDHEWGRPLAGKPAAKWTRWDTTSLRGQNFAERVAVEKIVQRRYGIQVNNNTRDAMGAPIDIVRIYTNVRDEKWSWPKGDGEEAGRVYFFDGAGSNGWSGNTRAKDETASRSVGILAGRRVYVTRQKATSVLPADEEQMYSLLLNEDVQVTVQNPRIPTTPTVPPP